MKGDHKSFDKSWNTRPEALYTHWTRISPVNQIQFAFRQHFETFERLYSEHANNANIGFRKFIELGAGRGSLSAYYSDNGDEVTVTDLSSKAIDLAKDIFEKNSLSAEFKVVDCENTNFDDNNFDICASIGLLEHFDDPTNLIAEQYRILNRNGICFAYIVPEKKSLVNEKYSWLNKIIASDENYVPEKAKDEIYRTNYGLDYYKKIFEKVGFNVVSSSGIYPVPMVSSSPEFPFTLLNEIRELAIVEHFEQLMEQRKEYSYPWLCPENYGNAILLVGQK